MDDNELAEALATLDLARFQLFAQGEVPESTMRERLTDFESEIGFSLPEDFRYLCMSPLGGLHIVAREDLWPTPRLHEVAPAWALQNGLSVYGLGPDVPGWLDLRRQHREAARSPGERQSLVPFMARTVPTSSYCFAPSGDIFEVAVGGSMDAEALAVDCGFTDLLAGELRALGERLSRITSGG